MVVKMMGMGTMGARHRLQKMKSVDATIKATAPQNDPKELVSGKWKVTKKYGDYCE